MVNRRLWLTIVALGVWGSIPVRVVQATAPNPRLVAGGCAEASGDAGARVCLPVRLEGRGRAVASAGFTLIYPSNVMSLPTSPGSPPDVVAGPVLTGGQTLTAVAKEVVGSPTGEVQVLVTPPLVLNTPLIADGTLASVCFRIAAGAPSGCMAVTFKPGATDLGDDLGDNLSLDPPVDGGVQVAGVVTTSTESTTSTTTLTDTTTSTTTTTTSTSTSTETTTSTATPPTTLPDRSEALPGKVLVLKAKPGAPDKRKITASLQEPGVGQGVGGPDDPTLEGASLHVVSSAAGLDATYPLPAANWQPVVKKGLLQGWIYKDKALAAGPIAAVQIKRGKQVKIGGKGAGLLHDLQEDPAPVVVTLRIGLGSLRYCAEFGGITSFKPLAQFKAKGAPAPAACAP